MNCLDVVSEWLDYLERNRRAREEYERTKARER